MAARTRTMTEMISDVRLQADIDGATDRHTDAALTRLINQSIQAFREWVSDADNPFFLSWETGTTVSGTPAITAFTAGPSVRIFHADIFVDSEWRTLAPLPLQGKNAYRNGSAASAGTMGVPTHYIRRGASPLELIPTPNGAYQYQVLVLPAWTDISGSGTFDGVYGWEEWVVWDVVRKVHVRDDYLDKAGLVTAMADKLKGEIEARSRKTDRSGPRRRYDVNRNGRRLAFCR